MKSVNVIYYGGDLDQYGIPEHYHSYLLISSELHLQGSGVCSVTTITDSDLPEPQHIIELSGGVDQALKSAIEKLKKLEQNNGLKELINES